MLTHGQIWAAIDALAKRYGYSPSGLARKAGLDATSFNKSKRISPQGRERWPSTESISKILQATGADFDEFARLVEPHRAKRCVPIDLISIDKIKDKKSLNKETLGVDGSLEEFDLLDFGEDEVIAVEITDDTFAPLYREDDIVVISPTATTRKGDRMLVCTTSGEVLTCELKRRTSRTLEVKFQHSDTPDSSIPRNEILWDARIMWVKQ